jgi:hypothetical protein
MYSCVVETIVNGETTFTTAFTGTEEECLNMVDELYQSSEYYGCVNINVRAS